MEIKSAANEAKLLKRKLMRTVPDRTLNAVADRNTPNPKLSIARQGSESKEYIGIGVGAGRGVEPPRGCSLSY